MFYTSYNPVCMTDHVSLCATDVWGKAGDDLMAIVGNFSLTQGLEGAKPLLGQTSSVAQLFSAWCG
jgi:hypothetical protein